MMINKIKQLFNELQTRSRFTEAQSRELEWADIYHDTIRGRKWLEDLPLSPGRWAANYSLLYILARILSDYKPETILEFGLGESSKVISSFLKNELKTSKHIIVEHNEDWIKVFENRFALAGNSVIAHHNSIVTTGHEFEINSYENLKPYSEQVMDLYLVDGISSARYSRNYIIRMLENVTQQNEFMIIMDDYMRQGEQDTANELLKMFAQKNIKTYAGSYTGNKSQLIIATEKYKFSTSF